MPSKNRRISRPCPAHSQRLDPVLGKLDRLPDHRIPAVQVPLCGPAYDLRPATRCHSLRRLRHLEKPINRYVRRGSKGIALLDESSGYPRLHYVFDVSDTGVRRNSRDPEVWQLNDDLFQPVSEMLAQEYGIHHERLSQQIADIAGKLAESYWGQQQHRHPRHR